MQKQLFGDVLLFLQIRLHHSCFPVFVLSFESTFFLFYRTTPEVCVCDCISALCLHCFGKSLTITVYSEPKQQVVSTLLIA